jgi:hypothetical protein
MAESKRDLSMNSCPSVMDMTLVAMNSEMSEFTVSRIGRHDIVPRSARDDILAKRSRIAECTLKMLEGKD